MAGGGRLFSERVVEYLSKRMRHRELIALICLSIGAVLGAYFAFILGLFTGSGFFRLIIELSPPKARTGLWVDPYFFAGPSRFELRVTEALNAVLVYAPCAFTLTLGLRPSKKRYVLTPVILACLVFFFLETSRASWPSGFSLGRFMAYLAKKSPEARAARCRLVGGLIGLSLGNALPLAGRPQFRFYRPFTPVLLHALSGAALLVDTLIMIMWSCGYEDGTILLLTRGEHALALYLILALLNFTLAYVRRPREG